MAKQMRHKASQMPQNAKQMRHKASQMSHNAKQMRHNAKQIRRKVEADCQLATVCF